MPRDHQTQRQARQQTPSRASDRAQSAPDHASNRPSATAPAPKQAEDAREVSLVAPNALPFPPLSPPLPAASPLLLTTAEAARALRINRSTLYPLLMRGEIPSIHIGRARRIPLEGLKQWIEQQLNAQHAHADGSA